MRIDNRLILAVMAALTLGLIPIAIYTSGPLRIVLSFLCMIFFPGYALLSVLFPKKDNIGPIERIALSFGAGIAIVPIIGLLLNFTPFGIKLLPILVSVALFTLVMSAGGFIRQQLLPDDQRFGVSLRFSGIGWQKMTLLNKWLLIAGSLAAIAVVSFAIYFEVALPPKQIPTEFYILNAEGRAADYPRQARPGQAFSLSAVAINHENQIIDFKIQVIHAGTVIKEIDTGPLKPEEKWVGQVSLILEAAGSNQKIEFFLYKDGEKGPYFKEPLYIYVDVSG